MSVSLPPYWSHNNDGTVTQHGGDRHGERMTSPNGNTIRTPSTKRGNVSEEYYGKVYRDYIERLPNGKPKTGNCGGLSHAPDFK